MSEPMASQDSGSGLRRIFRTIGVCASIAWSLLCFPHYLPWMIAFWLAMHTLLLVRGKPGAWPLFACLTILVIRLVPRFPFLLGLGAMMLCWGIYRARVFARSTDASAQGVEGSTFPPRGIRHPATLAVLLLIWGGWAASLVEYRSAARHSRQITLDPGRPILCVGDSLTEGMIPDRGYPGQLESMLVVPVVNQGASGIASGPAIGIVERAFEMRLGMRQDGGLASNPSGAVPQAVVIEVGGHDFLRWHSRSSTRANLVKLIEIARANGCEPVLMEIPRGFIFDPYASLERELAREYDLQLVDDRWLRHVVLMGPAAPPGRWLKPYQLSDDGIHSNPRGSYAVARFVADALSQLFGDEILNSGHGEEQWPDR